MKKNLIKSSLKNFIRKILYIREYKPIKIPNNKISKRTIYSFVGGNLNPDKVFYIIQRYPGYGIFSNLTFVVNHIKIALDMGFIPIVDMDNYTTIYNENKKICSTYNSWEYYYEQISPYSLDEVYKSKNIIITSSTFYSEIDFSYNITDKKELLDIFYKHIKVKKNKLKTIQYLKKKLFKDKKVLGVHFRGTGYKYARNPYPVTANQMINKINEILEKENYEKIFLMTEDSYNFKKIKEYYGEKIISLSTTVRGKTNQEVYDKYPRDRHRYKLGRDVLIETYLLSYCDGFFDIETNPRTISYALNLNPSQNRYTIDNGFNNVWRYFGYFKYSWFLKSILPERLGGFKNNKKPIKKLHKLRSM
jgi:hypothetical protein